MPTDKELKRAADESLDKFSKLYDPKGENPTATVNAYKLYKSLSLSDIEAKGDKPSSTAGKFAKGTLGIIQTQEAGGSYADSKSVVNAEKVFSLAFDTKGNLLESGKIFSNILEEAGTQGKQELSNQAVLLTDINTKTGLTGKLSKNYREEISAAYPALARLGIEYSELANAAVSLVQQSGKFNLINKEQFESMGLAAKAYVGSIAEVVEMIPGFERVGIGATGVVKAVSEAGARSINLGLSSQKITKELGLKKEDPKEVEKKEAREKQKEYRELNRDKINAQKREHYQLNKERLIKNSSDYKGSSMGKRKNYSKYLLLPALILK